MTAILAPRPSPGPWRRAAAAGLPGAPASSLFGASRRKLGSWTGIIGAYNQEGVRVLAGRRIVMAEAATLDDARRIVAALSAVEGVPTAALEGGALDEARHLLVAELTPRQMEMSRSRDRQRKV